jgi:hypothetical protein
MDVVWKSASLLSSQRAPAFARQSADLSGGVAFRFAFNFKIVSARDGRGDSVESEPLPIQLPIASREDERIRDCKTLTGSSVGRIRLSDFP